jgi:hypothetical protein
VSPAREDHRQVGRGLPPSTAECLPSEGVPGAQARRPRAASMNPVPGFADAAPLSVQGRRPLGRMGEHPADGLWAPALPAPWSRGADPERVRPGRWSKCLRSSRAIRFAGVTDAGHFLLNHTHFTCV